MNKYYPKLSTLSLMVVLLGIASTTGLATEISTQNENGHHQSTLHEGSFHLNPDPSSLVLRESHILSGSLVVEWASNRSPTSDMSLWDSEILTNRSGRSYMWGYLHDVEDAWVAISKYLSTTSLPRIPYFSSQPSFEDNLFNDPPPNDPKAASEPSHSHLPSNGSDESEFGFYLIEDTQDEKEPD